MDNSIISYLRNRHGLRKNPLISSLTTNFMDFYWETLDKVSGPLSFKLDSNIYSNLCYKLLKSHSAKTKAFLNGIKWFVDSRRFTVITSSGELSVWSAEKLVIEDIKRLPVILLLRHSSKQYKGTSGSLTTCTWLPNGNVFVVGDSGGNVHLTGYTLSPISILSDLQGHSIIGLSSSLTSRKIVAGALESHPVIWDIPSETKERSLTGSNSNQVALWDPRVCNILHVIMDHKASISNLQFSPCGHYLATSDKDSLIKIWNMKTLTCYKEIRFSHLKKAKITSILWHPIYTSQILVISDSNGNIHYFDLTMDSCTTNATKPQMNYHLFSQFNAHDSTITDMDFHPLGCLLTSISTDGKVKIWSIPSEKKYHVNETI